MNSEQKIGLAVFDTPAQQHAKSRTRFMILALICGGTMINYLDRSVMGIAAPSISADLCGHDGADFLGIFLDLRRDRQHGDLDRGAGMQLYHRLCLRSERGQGDLLRPLFASRDTAVVRAMRRQAWQQVIEQGPDLRQALAALEPYQVHRQAIGGQLWQHLDQRT